MLRLHRSASSAVLAAALAEQLAVLPADPFAAEVVAVPAKGVERWLSQTLSGVLGAVDGDGVAARIAFPHPTRLVDEAIAAATGHPADDDPWSPPRVLWALLETIDECLGEPWCPVLRRHLGDGTDEHRLGRRYATAGHLQQLFRSYAAHRPQLLLAWASGSDGDGDGAPLPPDLAWQAELWRRLRASLGAPSPAERLAGTCERLRAEPALSELPARLHLFGATRLTTEQRAVLTALGHRREVHLWLPHPSPVMWSAMQSASRVRRRAVDISALAVRHPLLASLARDTRELQLLLPDLPEEHLPSPPRPATLLGRLQTTIERDEPPSPSASLDGTVQVHACHGPARQVEVLREQLLALFQDDPSLEPRDVLVMCPDVDSYAPLIRACFGQPGAAHPGHRLRVRLADRALAQTNPLLDTLRRLLELAGGRVSAGDVLDLAASVPVRRAFSFTDDELEQLLDWAARTGVRWGIDERQRAGYSLRELPHNTWSTGLDRLLLGVAADETELGWLDHALPLDDVDSSDVELVGRLAELVERLRTVLASLEGPAPVAAWTAALGQALDLLTDVSEADGWQLAQARRELAEAAEHGRDAPLRLSDVRALLATRLAGRPTRANFRTGELTVCTMVPMRSVPHRVVALLGLDDGAFPRRGHLDGDDLLARDPHLGERDLRSEDRQLLLDAMLSAGDHLLLLYTGADPVSGARRPPSVPLGELLDVLTATTGADPVQRHPLQSFDARNFCPPQPRSFDAAALAGARVALAPRVVPAPLLTGPLPSRPVAEVLELPDLVAAAVDPVRAFLTRRIGLYLPGPADQLSESVPLTLDSLEKWSIGDRMLAAALAGHDPEVFARAERRRGTLPPGPVGEAVLAELLAAMEPLVAAARQARPGLARQVDVRRELGHARVLSGSVGDVHGAAVVSASYSRLGPKHRLQAWVRLLASGCEQAVTIGKGGSRRQPVAVSTLTRPPAAETTALLADLAALHDEAMRGPLPIALKASAAYADKRHRGSSHDNALAFAGQEFDGRFGDATDRYQQFVLGPAPRFVQLPTDPFVAWAGRLWAPLLAAEVLS